MPPDPPKQAQHEGDGEVELARPQDLSQRPGYPEADKPGEAKVQPEQQRDKKRPAPGSAQIRPDLASRRPRPGAVEKGRDQVHSGGRKKEKDQLEPASPGRVRCRRTAPGSSGCIAAVAHYGHCEVLPSQFKFGSASISLFADTYSERAFLMF